MPHYKSKVAVIGSGPGGAMSAKTLSENGIDTILIEEGAHLPQESCPPFSLQEMEQKYKHGGLSVALGRAKINYVEGRCVGGGSEINSALYHRTPSDVLETWQKDFQVDALTEKDLKPHFEACEKDLDVSTMPVGTTPLASKKLQEGSDKLGWKCFEIPRMWKYTDSQRGKKQSMTRTYIQRFLTCGGRLVPQMRVKKLKCYNGQWQIIAEDHNGVLVTFEVETVFLSCGTIQSAALLQKSGINSRAGRSFELHPTIKLIARFPTEVNTPHMGVGVHQVKEFPMMTFGCSISSRPYLAMPLASHHEFRTALLAQWKHCAVYYAMICPEGRGRIRTLPGFSDPLVRFSLTNQDLIRMGNGFKNLCRLLFEAGAERIYPLDENPSVIGPEAVDALPMPSRKTPMMTIHLFSSCAMGEDRSKCVVDSFGKIHEFDNLYIADASLLCTSPHVNPQGTIMAICRRNAQHYAEKIHAV